MTDPNIYNQKLSTSLMDYNPMYSAVLPYGDATPNRIGSQINVENISITDYLTVNFNAKYFTEVIGQGTTKKRDFYNGALSTKFLVNKMFDMSMPIVFEASILSENVQRDGSSIEKISFKNNLISGGLSIGIYDNLNIICGAKIFTAKGNEYLIERNSYDQIIDYNSISYDSEETILIGGLQYFLDNDMYITMQYNHFNVLDKNNLEDEFSMGRLIFMFNMNL